MTMYGKVGLLCRHLPYQASMKSSPKGRRVYTADSVIVEVCTKSSLTGSHRCILKFTRLLRK
ncbi:hypothetical protein T4D_6655, partial [Trichinella pseudospiralis]